MHNSLVGYDLVYCCVALDERNEMKTQGETANEGVLKGYFAISRGIEVFFSNFGC